MHRIEFFGFWRRTTVAERNWTEQGPTWFLDAFAKLQKVTTSFISVRPSVRMKKLGFHRTDFDET
jgi:hypothetical protein